MRAGLKRAAANVRAVAEAGVDAEAEVALPEGQTVRLREQPVRRAAVYAPGGRHPTQRNFRRPRAVLHGLAPTNRRFSMSRRSLGALACTLALLATATTAQAAPLNPQPEPAGVAAP